MEKMPVSRGMIPWPRNSAIPPVGCTLDDT
jgi:hypothetical protein